MILFVCFLRDASSTCHGLQPKIGVEIKAHIFRKGTEKVFV